MEITILFIMAMTARCLGRKNLLPVTACLVAIALYAMAWTVQGTLGLWQKGTLMGSAAVLIWFIAVVYPGRKEVFSQ